MPVTVMVTKEEAECLARALKRVNRAHLWAHGLYARTIEEKEHTDHALTAVAVALALKGFKP